MAGGDSKKSSHASSDEPSKDVAVSKELASIRRRRVNDKGKRFPTQVEDFVLILGFVYGALFALLLFSMSSGVFGDSTWMDHAASQTFLDRGDECNEVTETAWVHIYTDNDNEAISIGGYNLPEGVAEVQSRYLIVEENSKTFYNDTYENITVGDSGRLDTSVSFHGMEEDHYKLVVSIRMKDSVEGPYLEDFEPASNQIKFELENTSSPLGALPFISDEAHLEAHVTESGVRNCWTMMELGNWGFVLMGAELGGGRETAMLSGGAAGIPAWWMAFISLSLSVVSLFLLYPLMYKVYHQEIPMICFQDTISLNLLLKLLRILLTDLTSRSIGNYSKSTPGNYQLILLFHTRIQMTLCPTTWMLEQKYLEKYWKNF